MKEVLMPVPTGALKVERRSLRDVAIEQIQSAIFDGTLKPGERLNDIELQEWLGMSRTPIREALNDLSRTGLIEMAAQRYTRVASPDPAKRTEMLQTIGAMLGGIVRLTVPALTAPRRRSIGRALDAMSKGLPARDSNATLRTGRNLVEEIIEACPNPTLLATTRDSLAALTHQMTTVSDAASVRWDLLEVGLHQLSEAISRGDAVAAELAVEDLFRLSEDA